MLDITCLDLKPGTSLPSAARKAASWCLSQEHWAPSSEDLSSLPWTASQKLRWPSHLCPLPPLLSHSFVRRLFFGAFSTFQDLSQLLKDAEIDQSLPIRWTCMATSRPGTICGHFLANRFEVLVMGNYSFGSILNVPPY